ncbi:MAG: FGGY-family carbohydrate kinase [bacterium]
MSLMAIDVGTTGCKVMIFDLDGGVISRGYREYHLISPRPGWQELDSRVVWRNVRECMRETIAGAREDPVEAICVSSQGEAATPISKDGEILGNAPISFDERTVGIAAEWERKLSKLEILKITGQPLHSMHTINKIIWWKREHPEVYRRAWKFLCYEEFVFYMLGLSDPVTDYTMAARTMAFDIIEKQWSERMISLAGIDGDLFPKVRPSGEVVGEVSPKVASDLGLPRGVKVVTRGHDQPCGALGAGIIKERLSMDATGTVECVAPATREPVLNENMLRYNFCSYPHTAPNLYITLAFNFTGGSLLRWYRDTLAGEERSVAERRGADIYDVILDGLPAEPTSLMVLPHFTTTGTPHFDAKSRGAILGLTLNTSRKEIVKAILEGITYEMGLNFSLLGRSGVEIDEVRSIGGGAKSEAWLQLKADIFDRKVVSLDVSEAVCLGAAILAGVAIGRYSSIREAVDCLVRPKRTYYPDPRRAQIYRERMKIYESIYPSLKEINRALSSSVSR